MDINQNNNLLCRLESVSRAAAGCSLNFQSLEGVGSDIDEVSLFLGITMEQTVFFSCLSELSFHKTVSVDILAKHIGCSALKLVTMLHEIEALERKAYVQKVVRSRGKKYSYNDFGYNVPHNVIEALRKNDRTILEQTTRFDLPGFLRQVSDMVDERQSKELPTEDLLKEVDLLISNNLNLPFVFFVNNALEQTISKCTVFCAAYMRLKGQFCISLDRYAGTAFDDFVEQLEFSQEVAAGTHELIRKNIMKGGASEFESDKTIMLDHRAAKILYNDYPALLMPDPAAKGAIAASSITSKKLYYSGDILNQVRAIENVLQPKRFRTYRKALEKNGLSSGVTAIFFGAPGTGKTETVYQLARKTGRDICMVDLSETKSKWFGESEKRVRQIFVDYDEMMKNSELEPILFINEADGLFSKRTGTHEKSSSADQTMNTMQNILLQSLEGFQGILIATTNLTGNLDKAFERRFTFKLEFPRPDPMVRKSIWKSKIPQLRDEEAARLGEKFDITGGEIDIHVRQVILKKVLDRKVKILEALEESCSKDHGFSGRKRVGF